MATEIISVRVYDSSGVIDSTLTPHLDIVELGSNTVVVNNEAMTWNSTTSHYQYSFTTFDQSLQYLWDIDFWVGAITRRTAFAIWGWAWSGWSSVDDIWNAPINTYSSVPWSFWYKFSQYGGVSHVIDRSSFDEESKRELEEIRNVFKKTSDEIKSTIANIKPPQVVSEWKTTVVKYNDAQQNFIQEFITETIPELADKIDNLIPLLKTYEELILDFEQKEKDYEKLIEELINNK